MISSADKSINQNIFLTEQEQATVKPHEIIFQNIKENSLYRIKYTFNGRISEPKNVSKVIEIYENDFKLNREGVQGEPIYGGLIFSILVYDRETMHKIYFFLVAQRARVKVEHLNYEQVPLEKIQERILQTISN
ncbi:MAG: hypothetical protein ACUVXA_15605 [Candidatus Jordarchaeum sp.]|uniref:hypothetical protein n=1 Tax=Candidatus Jordarchaeum sp. TaxID=2823881 RepID=UPI00404B2853